MVRILWENKVGDYYIADVENNVIIAMSDELTKAEVDSLESLYDYRTLIDRDERLADDNDDMRKIPLTWIHKLHKIEV